MSSSAYEQESRPFIDSEDFTDDNKDNTPPNRQEPIFEGSYFEADAVFMDTGGNSRSYAPDYSDGIEGGVEPGFQNPPQNPQHPRNQAYPHKLQEGQQSSQSIYPHQAQYGAYGTRPPNNTANQDAVNGKLRYDAYVPRGMPGAGQQPAYPAAPFHDPRSIAATYHPYATTGQYVVIHQSQGPGGQPHAIIVRPIMENPPSDYMSYSIFATMCCCWLFGLMAIFRSRECQKAVVDGNRELAEKKSRLARDCANFAVCLGILQFVIAVAIGIRVHNAHVHTH